MTAPKVGTNFLEYCREPYELPEPFSFYNYAEINFKRFQPLDVFTLLVSAGQRR
jgi:hypothetical protein